MRQTLAHEILDCWQTKALDPPIELIEAGPGAGKTRTVIERLRRRQTTLEKAVALISFTNIAADEAKRRCSRDMLAFPHYVGTLDAFLHRYLVTPSYTLLKGEVPTYLLSWNDLPDVVSEFRIKGVSGQGVRLSTFKLDADGSVTLPDTPQYPDRAYIEAVVQASQSERLIERAGNIMQGLINRGIFDSDVARLAALRILEDEDSAVAKRLATRFGEIIIDEFQDCSDTEVRIVRALKKRGIHVVAVADPDQAIYEFRDASPEHYRNFRDEIPAEAMVDLEINYRSTPAISTFVSSLRSIGSGRIRSSQSTAGPEIVVAAGSADQQREIFRDQLVMNEIPEDEAIVLAHRRRSAQVLAGEVIPNQSLANSTSKSFTILRAIIELRDAKTAKARKETITRCERAVMALLDWSDDEKDLPIAHQMEIAGIERADIVAFLLEMQRVGLEWEEADQATESIRQGVAHHFAAKGPKIKSIRRAVAKLRPDHWNYWANGQSNQVTKDALLNSHIHGVKGMEYRAVMLSVEKPHRGLAFWDMKCEGGSKEALRVLYVGASRAEELLVLACRHGEKEALTRYLHGADVPFVVG